MEDHDERRIRPALWVLFGALVVPVGLLMALGAVGSGLFGMRTGIRAGRQGGGWLRRTPARVRGGLDVVLMLAGTLGAIVHQFAGGTIWPGVASGLLAAGFGVLIWRSRRRQAAHA